MQHVAQPTCQGTVGDWMVCVKGRLSNWCAATPPAASGEREVIQAGCYGSGSNVPDAGGTDS
jgi:hypothetical protein